jgi:hypothetical protein
MQVRNLAQQIEQTAPDWAHWPTEIPTSSYRYQAPALNHEGAMQAGQQLHEAFCNYTSGKWITPALYTPCLIIENALADIGVHKIHSEQPLRQGSLCGQVDLHGTLKNNRPVVIELKATLGEFATKPRPSELIQLATYAHLLGHQNPLLVCLRVALRQQRVNAFCLEESSPIIDQLQHHIAAAA